MADLFTRYNCTNCQDDISGIRVHCAICSNFDLCLQCFSAGAEIGEHKNDHAYQFMDTGTAILSIFRGKGAWSAREELRLLDAIEKYGFGNWEDISKHIETRSAEDAKEEYVNKYLLGSIGRHTWIPAQSHRPNLVDHTVEEDTGPLSSDAIRRLPPLDVTAEEAAQLGYMPNRDSFEREYDPTAETLVSALTLNSDDIETDLLLKLAQVDIYTRRLRERARRKRLVRDYQLVANFFRGKNIVPPAPRMTKELREFRDRFRVFAQFYTAHEYERLMASIERERDLRIRLSELNRYRWNGLTRIDECVHFEQHAAAAQNRNTGPYGHGRTDNLIIGSRPGSFSHSLHNRKIENGNERSLNFIGQKAMHHIGDQIYSDGSSLNKNCLDSYRGSSGQSITNQLMMIPTQTQQQLQGNSNQVHLQQSQINQLNGNIVNVNNQIPKQHQLSVVDQAGENPQVQQYQNPMSNILQNQIQIQNLQHLGENLLSSNEIQLCSSLNLPPTRYITLKTILLSGVPISANSSSTEASIRKYLIKAGWLGH